MSGNDAWVAIGCDSICSLSVYTLDTTPGKTLLIDGEEISVVPELAAEDDEPPFEIRDDRFVITVKSIPGLEYQVWASDSPDPATFQPAGASREATSTRRKLTVMREGGETKGFYKVQVR